MGALEIGAAGFGFQIVAVTLWQIIRNGIARSNGQVPEKENSWLGRHHPGRVCLQLLAA